MSGLQRCGKSCRLRWTNYLRPDLKHGQFTEAEEQTIVTLHSVLGNRYPTFFFDISQTRIWVNLEIIPETEHISSSSKLERTLLYSPIISKC